jgi:hypothetical protein
MHDTEYDDDAQDDDTPWKLADGTLLKDLVMNTPVEVRRGGDIKWRLGYFVRSDTIDGLPAVWVDVDLGPSQRFPVNFVRRYHGSIVGE